MIPKPIVIRLAMLAVAALATLGAGCNGNATAKDDASAAAFTSAGKSQAPITFSWRLGARPQIGEPLPVEISIVPAAPTKGLELSVEAGRGLDAVSGLGTLRVGALSAGEPHSLRLIVTPLVAGPLFVNVVAVMQTASGAQLKTFAVPVTVDDGASRKADVEVDADGERVVVMPAEER